MAKAGELPALRELLRISDAVMRANYFDEALEVIAEQALLAVNASSVSISRWERQHNAVRSALLLPCVTRAKISDSRSLSPSPRPGQSSPTALRARRTLADDVSPACTASSALTNSRAGDVFDR